MKRILSTGLFLVMTFLTYAQHIAVHAPAGVTVGETFRLEYSLNTVDVNDNLQLGNIPDAFDVVYGPSVSQQQSYSIVNGHATSSASITYTFMLQANKTGTFTIPAAHINVGGKKLSSDAVKVTVTGGSHSQNNQGTRFHQDDDNTPRTRNMSPVSGGRELFIKVSANKTTVHEQEPVLLTYKVYTTVNLIELDGKMPELNGFHTQEVDLPRQKTFHTESLDGRNYHCVTWSQYVMYPQMTGDLEIPPITFKGVVVHENRNVDPFEAFLNGGSGYIEEKREVEAPGIKIHVEPLPNKPAQFSGGVGRFNISAQLDKTEVSAGSPVNVRVVVGGTGNLKLIKQPELELPKDFDKYDPKVTDKTNLTANGVEGNMIYDYLIIPNHQGDYTIPPVQLTYYDTSANDYKTVKTQPLTLSVAPGENEDDEADESEMEADENDIRPIKSGDTDLISDKEFFFSSKAYFIWLAVPLVLFLLLLFLFRKRAIDNANVVKMKGKKANKVAKKRLRKAEKLMQEGKNDLFYDEVLRAIWGYVGDKLNMPVEQLSRDNVAARLATVNVEETTVAQLIEALDVCEFERYAPGDPAGNMNTTFTAAMNAITKIEGDIKTGKGHRHVSANLFILMALLIPAMAGAVTKDDADNAYKKGNYQQAISDYEELLKDGVSADIYYNLGNAYYRTENITRAIINYERAIMLAPADKDIRANLQLARSKTIDKITPESEMFFVTGYNSLVNMASVDGWAYAAVAAFILALVLILIFIFSDKSLVRRGCFYASMLCLVFFILANVFAYHQKKNLENRSAAIITAATVNVKRTPDDSGAAAFVLHEGSKVGITDKSVKGWVAVKLEDGREGWISVNQLEEI